MYALRIHRFRPLALLLMLLLLALWISPAGLQAQDPPSDPLVEAPPPSPTPDPSTDELTPLNYQGEELPDLPLLTPEPELIDPEPAPPVLPEGYQPPSALAELSATELLELGLPSQVQGDIQLDLVVSPERIRAGTDLTYTYILTNTTGETVSNLYLVARWTNFKRANASNLFQYCKQSNCPPVGAPDDLAAELATDIAAPTDTQILYRVTGSLAPGATGRFSVVLATRTDQYPRTGQAPKRPAGSAQLFRTSDRNPVISEDTANALFIGPVFVLSKAPTTTDPIFVGAEQEFTITLGNATAASDIIDDRIRSDATAATNITLTDVLPAGSSFISADGPVQTVENPEAGPVIWLFPGPLEPGQSVSVKVRFVKRDVRSECGTLSNKSYNVTSDEIPFKTGTTRYTINGSSSSVTVRTPLTASVVSIVPSSPIFGTEAVLTFQVQSYWPQAINDLEVSYTIQSNAWYVPSGTTPAPIAAPDGTTMGGTVTWRINMPAGTITIPSSQSFVLTIRGDYSSNGSGTLSIAVPTGQGVPTACINTVRRGVSFQPRLVAYKLPGPEEETNDNGDYAVNRGSPFTYLIRLQNNGLTEMTDLIVDDLLPTTAGANFTYVPNSSRLNDAPYEPDPDDIVNGEDGWITWRNISVPSQSSVDLQFQLYVNGYEFQNYCNNLRITALNNEPVRLGSYRVCVRVDPPIVLTKIADRATIDGNDSNDTREVTFTLTVTNQDSVPYDLAFYDVGDNFQYVRMLDDGPAPTQVGSAFTYEWPRITLAANGGHYQLRFVARLVPSRCANDNYNNDLNFRFWPSGSSTSYVVPSNPLARATVRYFCGSNLISYSKAVDASTIGLRDRHLYTINIKNENASGGSARTNIQVVDVLPPGFSYAGMASGSAVRDEPTITTNGSGQVQLAWPAPNLNPAATTNVKFYARSGDIVGNFANWLRVTADGMEGVKGCTISPPTDCFVTRAVKVEPLATLEPSINNPGVCANPAAERIYRLALVNTNRHAYNSTVVTVTLPLGLSLSQAIGSLQPTIVSQDQAGTVLRWENLSLPQKPSSAPASQIVLDLQLNIGQVWGPLQPEVEAYSPDGTLPKKDGVLSPNVMLCELPDQPRTAIAIEASKRQVFPDEEFYYFLSVTNPTTTPLTLDLRDVLDSRLTYLASARGPAPSVSGATLTWNDLEVPALANDQPGVVMLVYKVKATGGLPGDEIPNRADVDASSVTMNTVYASVNVEIIAARRSTYLPLTMR